MRAFTFGKYYPFHLGHVALINFALEHCNELFVLVCASDQESISVETRINWITEHFSNEARVKVIPFEYKEDELPNSSVSSREISEAWANVFKKKIPDAERLVTSEKYGDFVSEYMGIQHIYFDQERKHVPVSATEIRKNTYEQWDYLPDAVKPYFQKSIGFLGTESTGKSSISQALSEAHNSSLVTEVGREIIPNSNSFTLEDLKNIAKRHAENIVIAKKNLKPFVLIDTDIYITLSYAQYNFGEFFDPGKFVMDANKFDHRFYLLKDDFYQQDGTRLPKDKRDQLDKFHRSTLSQYNVIYEEVTGNWDQRFEYIASRLKQI